MYRSQRERHPTNNTARRKDSSESSRNQNRNKDYHNKYRPSYSTKPTNDILSNRSNWEQESDIKNHVKFYNIRVRPEDENKMLHIIKQMLIQNIGQVTHVTREDYGTSPQYEQAMNFSVGFKYDMDAYNFIQDQRELSINYGVDHIIFKPIVTPVFESMIPVLKFRKQIEHKKIKQTQKDRDAQIMINMHSTKKGNFRKYSNSISPQKRQHHQFKRSPSRSRDRQYHDRHERTKSKKQKKNQSSLSISRSISSSRSRQNKNRRSLVTLLIWGIPIFINEKHIATELKQMKEGPFQPQYLQWMKKDGVQYLKIKLQEKKADKLIRCSHNLIINSYPVVITQNFATKQELLKMFRQFQVLIHFPKKVHAFHLYKSISPIASIVQIVSEGQVQNGQSESFFVTIANPLFAEDLKKLVKTSTGIIISQPLEGHMIYRPNKNTMLPPMKSYK